MTARDLPHFAGLQQGEVLKRYRFPKIASQQELDDEMREAQPGGAICILIVVCVVGLCGAVLAWVW